MPFLKPTSLQNKRSVFHMAPTPVRSILVLSLQLDGLPNAMFVSLFFSFLTAWQLIEVCLLQLSNSTKRNWKISSKLRIMRMIAGERGCWSRGNGNSEMCLGEAQPGRQRDDIENERWILNEAVPGRQGDNWWETETWDLFRSFSWL